MFKPAIIEQRSSSALFKDHGQVIFYVHHVSQKKIIFYLKARTG